MRILGIAAATLFIATLAACELTIVPPGAEVDGTPEGVELAPPEAYVGESPGTGVTDLTPVGPYCLSDEDCLEDDACPGVGGCDGDPCRDDRCFGGQCLDMTIEGCHPGYLIEYAYSACCPERNLTISPDGRCYFEVEGEGIRRCDDVGPTYIQALVDHAWTLGFFDWGLGHCVPGETQADFSLHLKAGDYDNQVYCEQGVCVGELCNVLDGVWAALPSNWHDGCGCD
jgi:hypothetical protein